MTPLQPSADNPSRGVVDEAMAKRLRWLAARIRINPRIEFTKGDDIVFDEAAAALQAVPQPAGRSGSGDGHANAVAILDEWADWIGQRPQIVNQTDMRVAFMAGAAAAHKAQAAALPAVPEGWKLVPIVPTPKMIDATWNDPAEEENGGGPESHNTRNHRIYTAMLAATPAHDQPEGSDND